MWDVAIWQSKAVVKFAAAEKSRVERRSVLMSLGVQETPIVLLVVLSCRFWFLYVDFIVYSVW